eukprot:scaffold228791_cov36-Cyclotella_meneghiniana.AAC.1
MDSPESSLSMDNDSMAITTLVKCNTPRIPINFNPNNWRTKRNRDLLSARKKGVLKIWSESEIHFFPPTPIISHNQGLLIVMTVAVDRR